MKENKVILCVVLFFLILTTLNVPAETVQAESGENSDIIIESENKTAIFSNPNPGDTWKDPDADMEFIFVPKGCFKMGSNSGDDDEKPVHEVCLDGFWIGKYEVTQSQWVNIMGQNPSRFQYGNNYPVEQVCWQEVKKFILKLNQQTKRSFSLPTEAQWEYAARSRGKDQSYAGGDNIDDLAWYRSNAEYHTHEVGKKEPNGLGIYDMSGNVSEWCEDIYSHNAYSKHQRNNPLMTSGGSSLVHRGGSWVHNPGYVRATCRLKFSAYYLYSDIGFRLCLPHIRQ